MSELNDQIATTPETRLSGRPEVKPLAHVTFPLKWEDIFAAAELDDRKSGKRGQQTFMFFGALLVIGFFLFRAIKDPTFYINYVMMGIAALSILINFYMPRKNNRDYANKMVQKWKGYEITVWDNYVEIWEGEERDDEGNHYRIQYNGELKIFETQVRFVFEYKKDKLFLLPKELLKEEEILALHDLFRDRGKDNYLEVDDKTGKRMSFYQEHDAECAERRRQEEERRKQEAEEAEIRRLLRGDDEEDEDEDESEDESAGLDAAALSDADEDASQAASEASKESSSPDAPSAEDEEDKKAE